MPLTRQQKAYKVNLPPLSPQHRDGRSFRTFAHTTFTAFDAAFHPGTGSSGTRESETQEDLFTAILTVQNRKNESLFMKNETYITINAH